MFVPTGGGAEQSGGRRAKGSPGGKFVRAAQLMLFAPNCAMRGYTVAWGKIAFIYSPLSQSWDFISDTRVMM